MGLENRARLVARCFQRLPSFGGVVGSPCLLFLRFAQRRGENGGPARPGALVQLWFTPGRMWRGGEDAPPDLPQPPRGLGLGRWPLSSSLVRRESGVVGPKVRGVGRRRGLRERGWGQRGSRMPWSPLRRTGVVPGLQGVLVFAGRASLPPGSLSDFYTHTQPQSF